MNPEKCRVCYSPLVIRRQHDHPLCLACGYPYWRDDEGGFWDGLDSRVYQIPLRRKVAQKHFSSHT